MRKLAIALALSSTALATPALARDHSFYAGLEGGVMLVEDAGFELRDDTNATILNDAAVMNFKPGFDVDVIAGYDFGLIRLEGELSYKRASLDEIEVRDQPELGIPFGAHFPADGNAHAVSGMVNGLLDFGDEDRWSGYVGAGVGLASVHYSADSADVGIDFSDSDSRLAWQAIAGIRTAISPTLDVGLKYRFFNVPNVKFDGQVLDSLTADSVKTRWRSHSLLLSLIYNFAPPPPRRLAA
jgi:opacity protein-like surface antigen